MKKKSVAYIAGMGIITAIGNTLKENLNALKNEKSGISQPEILQTIHNFPVGEIKLTNDQLAVIAETVETLPRTALLSIIAAKEAWMPFKKKSKDLRIGFISANTVGGMDLTETVYDAIGARNEFDITKVKHHECAAITDLTCEALGLTGWSTTISTACSSSANTIMMGAKLIEHDKMDIVIAGGADSLSKFTLNGFNALMILDKEACKPFDANRKGLNLGEGAAYMVLMNEKAIIQTNASKLAIIAGYANANDAHHQTASSPEGKGNQLAMYGALKQAGIDPGDINYINLHGTGTGNNDNSEGMAISAVFEKGEIPSASSTKAFTGHTLGAAGAVEAVFSVLAIHEKTAWPSLRIKQPIHDLNWQPISSPRSIPIKHVLSNSFGFGGNCSALVISKVKE